MKPTFGMFKVIAKQQVFYVKVMTIFYFLRNSLKRDTDTILAYCQNIYKELDKISVFCENIYKENKLIRPIEIFHSITQMHP